IRKNRTLPVSRWQGSYCVDVAWLAPTLLDLDYNLFCDSRTNCRDCKHCRKNLVFGSRPPQPRHNLSANMEKLRLGIEEGQTRLGELAVAARPVWTISLVPTAPLAPVHLEGTLDHFG
ncbi:hypothetical protein MYX78_03655, partial [Acidobacteria bacterium AH-259-G07]|nr:hypothetical protein [Acidobacteria bacterium AH-259-G07]